MPKVYAPAEAVESLVPDLIRMYHPELATARIKYIFVDKASSKNGKPVLGKVRRITGILDFDVSILNSRALFKSLYLRAPCLSA